MQSYKLLACGAFIAAVAAPACASVVVYSGSDADADAASPHPNSAAAAAAFDAAVSGASLVTFESAPVGAYTSLTIAPGVTLTGTDYQGNNQTINNNSNFSLNGYNTTPGGTNFALVFGGSVTFSFATPISAFGAYFSGVQTGFFADVITFSDGTSRSISLPDAGQGALDFVGFTDFGQSISSVTLNFGPNANTGFDFVGVDDVRFANAPAISGVPEPQSWALMMLGFGAIGGTLRRRGPKLRHI